MVEVTTAERECYASCRSSFNSFMELIKMREYSETNIDIEEDVFEVARKRASEFDKSSKDQQSVSEVPKKNSIYNFLLLLLKHTQF